MQLLHNPIAMSASFDDPNLVSTAGLVPVMRLADDADLQALAQDRLTVFRRCLNLQEPLQSWAKLNADSHPQALSSQGLR